MSIAVPQPDGSVVQIAGTTTAGVTTLTVTNAAADTFVLLPQPATASPAAAASAASRYAFFMFRSPVW